MRLTNREFTLFTLPAFAVIVILMIAPLLYTMYQSMQFYVLGMETYFNGLSNYLELLKMERFWDSLGFTLFLTIVSLGIKLVLGFLFAYLLHKVIGGPVRTLFYAGLMIPIIVPPAVGALVFSWLFKDSFGIITYLLNLINIEINWYDMAPAARALVTMHWIWCSIPFAIIILFAGLEAMPQEPMEAALVDGAGFFQRVFYVIVPYLAPLIIVICLIDVMDGFRIFDSVAVLTKGGPGTTTESLQWLNYQLAFRRMDMGKGSAMAILNMIGIFILIIPFLVLTYRDHKEN